MKVIDILNKLEKNEVQDLPEKIKFDDTIYCKLTINGENPFYQAENKNLIWTLMEDLTSTYDLSKEVEIVNDATKLMWNDKSKFRTGKDEVEMLMSRTEQLKKAINDILERLENNNDYDER